MKKNNFITKHQLQQSTISEQKYPKNYINGGYIILMFRRVLTLSLLISLTSCGLNNGEVISNNIDQNLRKEAPLELIEIPVDIGSGFKTASGSNKFITKITWTSGSQKTDFDLFIKSPDGQTCNYSYSNRDRSEWGAKHLRDDRGRAYSSSSESFSVDLDKMNEYASKKNLFDNDQGRFKFYISRWSGPDISFKFSFGYDNQCSAYDSNDCPRGNWVRNVSGTKEKNALYAVQYTPTRVSTSNLVQVRDIPGIMRKKGWNYAPKLMKHWFNASGSNYIIDMDDPVWLSTDVSRQFSELKRKAWNNELLTRDAANNLKRELENTNQWSSGGYFNFIDSEMRKAGQGWQTADWEKRHMNWIIDREVGDYYTDITQYNAAFGKAALRVVASGRVIHHGQRDYQTLKVEKVGIYFKDSYDFEGSQRLGCWSFSSPYVLPTRIGLDYKDSRCIHNSSFRDYNRFNGHDKTRGNFRIFSNMIEISTNQSFNYGSEQPYGGGGGGSW